MSNSTRKLNERRRTILSLLSRDGNVHVAQISRQLGVSEVTIRKDLEFLEQEGLLERTHGGAIAMQSAFFGLAGSKISNAEAKTRLARAAVSLIKDNDTLLLNDGSTNYFLAMELVRESSGKNLRVLTNAINIAGTLAGKADIQPILLGGIVNARRTFTYGSDVLKQMEYYRADKLFLSVDGVDVKGGVTTRYAEDAPLLQMMIERSRQVIVVADYTKIGYEGFFRIIPLSAMHTLITNRNANPETLEEIAALGVQILKI